MDKKLDNSLKPIESFVQQGLAQRFQQVFGLPLVYSNAPDKKAAAQKLLERGLKYPMAFASVTGESVGEGSYRPHALWRRGLTSGMSADDIHGSRLNLIPVSTEYEVTVLCKSMAEVQRIKKLWLLGSVQNALKFSVLFGAVNLDVHVVQDKRVSLPQREGGLTEAAEYPMTMQVTVSGYLSTDDFAKAQVVNDIELSVYVDTELELVKRLDTSQPMVYGVNQNYVLQEVGSAGEGNSNLIDISTPANTFNLILTEDRTIGFTGGTAALDGKRFVVRITQGEPGGYSITWDTESVSYGGDIPEIELTSDVGQYDYIGFIYRHSARKCDLIAYSRAYA
jgi:hypothetical protein